MTDATAILTIDVHCGNPVTE